MIFLTVGTQLPFDRLVEFVDTWCSDHKDKIVFGQIGPAKYLPRNFEYVDFMSSSEMAEVFQRAELVIAHAGMGTVLTALKERKPLVLVPRLASLSEHRNDHQLATARWLQTKLSIPVAYDRDELYAFLNLGCMVPVGNAVSEYASQQLIEKIRSYMLNKEKKPCRA